MHWNNRIFRHAHEYKNKVSTQTIISYALHEAHYDGKKKQPASWTVDSMCGHFDTVDDLIKGLEIMLRDAKRSRNDVLEYEPKKRKKNKTK